MINIARDFSRTPAGRSYTDGPSSGEKFREELLIPQLRLNEVVEVVLDGTAGLPSSFLDEAFGGLVRARILTAHDAHRRLKLVAVTPSHQRYITAIWHQIDRAAEQGLALSNGLH